MLKQSLISILRNKNTDIAHFRRAAERLGYVLAVEVSQLLESKKKSIETPIGDDEETHLSDFVEDSLTIAPSDAAAFSMLQSNINEVLDTLKDREKKIILLRYGLSDGHPRTLEEVGREFSLTRERIRQIEFKVLSKLRKSKKADSLKEFLVQ